MSLSKAPLTFLVTCALYICYGVRAAPKEERVQMNEGVITARRASNGIKYAISILGAQELVAIALKHFSLGEGLPLYLTPLSITGAALIIVGSYIRKRCYVAMGRLFTGDLSVRKDHKLITHGPYSVVRHPSYIGGALNNIGLLMWFWAPGGFLRETNAWPNRILGFMLTAAVMRLNLAIPVRVVKEDEMMKNHFGSEWEDWAKRAPQKEERLALNEGPISMRQVTNGKFSFWAIGIIESALILRNFVNPQANEVTPYLTPISAAGAIMVVVGAYIRKRCYETMGSMFTIEVSVRKDHRLITHGPYSVVRHPSYSGGYLAIIGGLVWYWSRGSFVRESDVLGSKLLAAVATVTTVWPAIIIPNRIGKEDEALRQGFGGEWEDWARRTFASSTLDVAVPDISLDIPTSESFDGWLNRIRTASADRKQAFFDEQLRALLILRIKHPSTEEEEEEEGGHDTPPQSLLAFLAHLQVSFEASYISPVPDPPSDPRTLHLSTLPKASSLSKGNPRLSLHPAIFPPNTPNPTPSVAEHDRKYVASEGTLLIAGIWGQSSSSDSIDAKQDFNLLWSSEEQVWVAIYSFSFTVSFLRLSVTDPLLCLTISATLRDKPITTTSSKDPLALFLAKAGSQSNLVEPESPTSAIGVVQEDSRDDELHGFEEVNLLEGLHAGPTFSSGAMDVSLPSSRLGIVSRQKLFSLPPINLPTPEMPTPSPMTALRTAHPTLRKAFRKTLQTVSGFRVRMRTVFVPFVLLPGRRGSMSNGNDGEREEREAGNEERTIVLCVEIDNSGESGPDVGFEVEKVDVQVGGGDAQAILIGWGEAFLKNMDESNVFPLQIDSRSQYNLLYAVSFLQPPDELEGLSIGRGQNGSTSDLQRPVTIYIHGRPYEKPRAIHDGASADVTVRYPTSTFSSRWNCVLDLAIYQSHNLDTVDVGDPSDPTSKYPNVLPEPASPFPLSGTKAGGFFSPIFSSPSSTPRSSLIAPSQRLSIPLNTPRTSNPNHPFTPSPRASNRQSDQQLQALNWSARLSYLPPSQSLAAQSSRPSTTYNVPQALVLPSALHTEGINNGYYSEQPPPTPAYPPHSPYPPSPPSHGPISVQGTGSVGPNVETRRDRGSAVVSATPLPGGSSLADQQRQAYTTKVLQKLENGETIVVSVRLMSRQEFADEKDEEGKVDERIYPLTRFRIEVFVFNRSTWTRRFELSCPSSLRRRKEEMVASQYGAYNGVVKETGNKVGYPGIMPMDNRVRIGPLRPSACQTVRMSFLAVSPGVHSIDTLTLTDIESGYSTNLRSVMDVVVHEDT
ncbi:hypothetical protein AX17_001709 [Amanita inopinata Kibby_2008]|nr:hypothetical protein AX17_001709 [Amanita inopinata Kibby_2008]